MRVAVNGRIGRGCAAVGVILVCLAIFPGAAFAQKVGSVVITPSTRAGDAQPDRVLVLPFSPVGPTEAWRGRSVQQSLVADLTAAAPARVGAADTPASDAAAASAVAKQAGARYVVFGAVTSAGSELRYTGQLVDTTTGQSVAGLKATGPAIDAFRLEDALATQLKRQLALGKSDELSRPASDPTHPAPDGPRDTSVAVADTRPIEPPAWGQIIIVPGHPRSAARPASDPSDDPRNDVNGQPLLPAMPFALPLRSLDAADVYGGPIIYYPPCYSSCYTGGYYSGCYGSGFGAYGYGLGYSHGYGGFGGYHGSFGGFRRSSVGFRGGSSGAVHGPPGGGHSHGGNFASRR